MKILVVEDDRVLGNALKFALERAGYSPELARTLAAATDMLGSGRFGAVILDLGLPDGDGLDLLRAARQRGDSLPILVLTARDGRMTRLGSFDMGADDVLAKPFDLDELLARLKARVRRTPGIPGALVSFGQYELDLDGRVVSGDGVAIHLTAREFRVLSFLAKRAGRWASKFDIENHVYAESTEVNSNTIETAIYGLRKKLGRDVILCSRGLGYMVRR